MITITSIQPSDSIASSRLTLNSNFSAIKAGVDAVQQLLDPSTLILSGVKSISVNDNSVSLSNSILNVGKGSSLLGNVIMGTTGASTSVLINGNGGVTIVQSSLTLGSGNLSLTSGSSVATFGGDISVQNELRLPGVSNAFASVVSLTQSATLTISDLKYLVISNGSTAGGSGLTASLPVGNAGQVIEVYHSIGASGFPIFLNGNFQGLTGSIVLTQNGDNIRIIFDGSQWYLWNYNPASFGTTVGPTGSSITFTFA